MIYKKPELKLQLFLTDEYLDLSSVDTDDELPGDPDTGHTIITDAAGEILTQIFTF